MGSVVTVRVTAASRWNVTGDIVSVVFQPPGAPPVRCTPDIPNGAATSAGEVHPRQHREPQSRSSPSRAPQSQRSGSSEAASVRSNGEAASEASSQTRNDRFADGTTGAAAGNGDEGRVNCIRGGSLTENNKAESGASSCGREDDAVQSAGCGCAADSCCQREPVATDDSAGGKFGHSHSSCHSAGSDRSDMSRHKEPRDALQHGSARPLASNSNGSVNAPAASSSDANATGQRQHASSAGHMKNRPSAVDPARGLQSPATAHATKAATHVPPHAAATSPEKQLSGALRKGGGHSVASSIADTKQSVLAPRRSSEALKVCAVPSKGKVMTEQGSLQGTSLQCNGSSAWSGQAVDVLLSAGILLGLTGVLISGMLMLLSS